MTIRFQLSNGWTLSICEEVAPAACNVAAWPSTQDDASEDGDWFDFGEGKCDVRCYGLAQMLASIEQVRSAPPPAPREV